MLAFLKLIAIPLLIVTGQMGCHNEVMLLVYRMSFVTHELEHP
jgi:hypothetical protein